MQVRYTAPHGQFKPGDVVDIPDGAAFSADYLEPVTVPPAGDPPGPSLPSLPAPAVPVTAPPPAAEPEEM